MCIYIYIYTHTYRSGLAARLAGHLPDEAANWKKVRGPEFGPLGGAPREGIYMYIYIYIYMGDVLSPPAF